MLLLTSTILPTAQAHEVLPPSTVTVVYATPIPPTIEEMVAHAQKEYNLDDSFTRTLKCESAGWQNIQSMIPVKGGPNGREDSWGVAQIHLPSHPSITRAQALDPVFAINWTAQQFKAGRAYMWSCFK